MAFSASGMVGLLMHVPTALFPIALGLAGVSAALTMAARSFEWTLLQVLANGLLFAASIVLVIDVLLYLLKLVRDRAEVIDDLSTADRANLIAPGLMAAMLIGGVLAESSMFGGPVWLIATLGHLVLLLRFVGQWLKRTYMPEDLNPTWFLPAAGIMTSALSWPGYGSIVLPTFTFAIGAMLWIMLLPLVFRRLVFEPAIEPRLRPTLFIVAAPFGLFANALVRLHPNTEPVIPAAFAFGGAFFILVLVAQIRFLFAAGVSLSWWATTFPVATVAAGLLRVGPELGNPVLVLGSGMLVLACFMTVLAIIATFRSAWRTCLKTVDDTRKDIAAMHGYRR
ncbi:MAG: hypothetical protein AAFV47_03965 [Pseudomonadota bacterium]